MIRPKDKHNQKKGDDALLLLIALERSFLSTSPRLYQKLSGHR